MKPGRGRKNCQKHKYFSDKKNRFKNTKKVYIKGSFTFLAVNVVKYRLNYLTNI